MIDPEGRQMRSRSIFRLLYPVVTFAAVVGCKSGPGASSDGGRGGLGSGGAGAPGSGGGGVAGGAPGSGGSGGPGGAAAGGSGGAGQSTDGGAGSDATDAGTGICVTPATPGTCTPLATPICKLSLTGCMDPPHVTQFVSRAIPYQVNSPLWSDNAAKTRAFVLPAGGKIHIKDCTSATSTDSCNAGPADTGKWVFPVGTVFIKNFMFDGKLVETRLFMHADAATAAQIDNGGEWVGYNYAWNEAQTEATLVPNQRVAETFDTGMRTVTWNFPHWGDCTTCHTPGVDTLGPETDQLNRVVSGANQLDTFATMKLFDVPPAKPYPAALLEPYANAALGLTGPPAGQTEAAARSYLHANCGYCHRPDVNDVGFDLRFGVSLKDTGMCNLMAQKPATGVTDSTKIFAPGSHTNSALWIRVQEQVVAGEDPQASYRMPQIASYVVDTGAAALLAAWIDATKSCP
jgi:cytochrome c551/c552